MNESFFKGSGVIELTEKDFDKNDPTKLSKQVCSMVLFYAPWCGHCQAMKDEYRKAGNVASAIYKIYAVNSEKNKDLIDKIKTIKPDFIQGFPTIAIFKKGERVDTYTGERTTDAFIKFAMDRCK